MAMYLMSIFRRSYSGKSPIPPRKSVAADGLAQSRVMVEPTGFNCATDANVLSMPSSFNVGDISADYVPRHSNLFNAAYADGHVCSTTHVPEMDINWGGTQTSIMPMYTCYTADQPHSGSALTTMTMNNMDWGHAVSTQAITDGTVQFSFVNPGGMNQMKVGLGDSASPSIPIWITTATASI